MMQRLSHRAHGFTIVELMIAISLSTVIMVTLVGMLLQINRQFSNASARQDINTEAQLAVNQINDDFKNSNGLRLYNDVADDQAPNPNPVTGSSSYAPGNPISSSYKYNWRLAKSQLVLDQTVRDSSGKPVYSNTSQLQADHNIIVYYVKDGSLWRRVIAGSGNATATLACSTSGTNGGCTTGSTVDKLMVRHLSDFIVKPLNQASIPIKFPEDGGSSDYSQFAVTRLIEVSIKVGQNQSGQQLAEVKGGIAAPRTTTARIINAKPYFQASMLVGPGGITGDTSANTSALTVQTSGPITLKSGAQIGFLDQPSYISSSSKYCGTGNSYGTIVCSTPPVDLSTGSPLMYGTLCATNQSSVPSNTVFQGSSWTTYIGGFIANCSSAPNVVIPTYDKTTMVSSMSSTGTGASGSCDGSTATPTSTLIANRTYDPGDVTITNKCTATLKGNIYIKGNLNITNEAILQVDPAVTTRPVILVNGVVTLNVGAQIKSNGSNAPLIVSFDSSSCSTSATTCTISNTELSTSIARKSIKIWNSATAYNTLFFAQYGGVDIHSNGIIRAGAIAGQKVSFDAGASIVLDQ